MAKYIKRPVIIEAREFNPQTDYQEAEEIAKWCGGYLHEDNRLTIETLEGVMAAEIGDYIIEGVNGEFYPCKPDIFFKTYESV